MNFEFWYHPYFGKQHLHTIIEEYTDLEIKEFGKDLIDTSKINLIPFYWENKLVDSRRIIDTKEFSDILIELDKNDFYLIGDFSGEASENYSDELWDKNLNIIFSKCKKNRFLIIQNNFDISEVKEIYYGSYKVKTIHLPYFILSTPIFMNDYISDLSQYENLEKKKPNLDDDQTKKEILELVVQKSKFDYNKNLLEKIQNKEFTEQDFLNLGKDQIQSLKLNSIKDNNKFEINSVQMLYSLPLKSITLINDEKNNIYLAKINNYDDLDEAINPKDYEKFSSKENTEIRNNILKSYDLFLNQKYNVDINQVAINNVKNLFQ